MACGGQTFRLVLLKNALEPPFLRKVVFRGDHQNVPRSHLPFPNYLSVTSCSRSLSTITVFLTVLFEPAAG